MVTYRLQVCSIVLLLASSALSFHHNSLSSKPLHGIFQQRNIELTIAERRIHGILRSATAGSETSQVYGITASGQPCKRCLKLGEYCWQHKWQENNLEISKDKSIASWWTSCNKSKAYAIAGLLTILATMGFAALNYLPFSNVIQSIKTVSTQVLKHHNATSSLLRLLPLSALAFAIAFVKFLRGQRIDTMELLRTVDKTVQKVRYVGDLPAFQTPLPTQESDPVVSSSSGSRPTVTILRNQRTPYFARPASQLMATNNDEDDEDVSDSDNGFSTMDAIKTAIPLVVLVALASQHEHILHFLQVAKTQASPAHLRDTMVPILDRLNNAGIKGQVAYTLCLLVWTMTAGITTPVETAAGIAFGAKKGIICNATGKIGGALLSFLLGRHFLYKFVHRKLKGNELLGLVDESIEENPLGVSLMMRFSPLPEFAKNFGLSILKVPARWFALAVLLHGLPFTCLWTSMGAETAAVMRGAAPSRTLKILMTGVTWFGFVSPTVIGLWINSLRKKSIERKEGETS